MELAIKISAWFCYRFWMRVLLYSWPSSGLDQQFNKKLKGLDGFRLSLKDAKITSNMRKKPVQVHQSLQDFQNARQCRETLPAVARLQDANSPELNKSLA